MEGGEEGGALWGKGGGGWVLRGGGAAGGMSPPPPKVGLDRQRVLFRESPLGGALYGGKQWGSVTLRGISSEGGSFRGSPGEEWERRRWGGVEKVGGI